MAGAACIVAHNLVHNLVEKVTMESVDIRALLLGTLSCCVQVNAIPALQSNGVSILRCGPPTNDLGDEDARVVSYVRVVCSPRYTETQSRVTLNTHKHTKLH